MSYAGAINAAGLIVGTQYIADNVHPVPYVWAHSNSQPAPLPGGTLTGVYMTFGVNASGQIFACDTGYDASNHRIVPTPVFWNSPSDNRITLPLLPGAKATASAPTSSPRAAAGCWKGRKGSTTRATSLAGASTRAR